ncbi:primosomal protein N' [Acidihalobacter ferrooxydans]|uniref:Replication restart protein PriA n=1 Tax=Acidihalobacter ferrooxydans TaxID=1765967 RepID=A0A1P8ULG5_9GAMM|nr:primosomal protein N' [Acidihalobacter ferrooxydans]
MVDDCVRVAVPVPLREALDYLPPVVVEWPLQPGMRVRVRVGRRRLIGLVVATGVRSALPRNRLRPIEAVLDAEPLLDDATRELIRFAADYYHYPIGEVAAAALPERLRNGGEAQAAAIVRWRLTPQATPEHAALARAPRQRALVSYLLEQGADAAPLDTQSLTAFGAGVGVLLRELLAKGLVERVRESALAPAPGGELPPALHAEQRAAVDAVWPSAAAPGYATHVLEGVTGSGKTEVYMTLIARALAAGRQTLLLVPEIGLTPQLLARLRRRFAVPLAALHSGLADAPRRDGWLAARSGEADIVVGTRSAVFTPLPRLGLIVVDEEHDASFKQQEGLRYHGRDLAVWRARRQGVPIVLGSATPALETLQHARRGHYARHRLATRAGGARAPLLRILDIRHGKLEAGLSAQLLSAVRERLERNEQVLLFLNRRGFAPVLICHECGWAAQCPRCDAHMTYHAASNRLRCHHCGHETPAPPACPECAAPDPRPIGQGTERVEQALAAQFPDVGILRIDRDTTRRRGALDATLEDAHSGRFPLLLGTQMLTKGHHLPNVTLVGVIDADQGLFSADYRAHERLAQLLVQVAGRAGRAQRPGEVIIQTHQPEHPLLHTLLAGGYRAAADTLLSEREAAAMPPFTWLALLRAEAAQQTAALAFLNAARKVLDGLRRDVVDVLGPVPAPMERRAGRYRAQLLLRSGDRGALHALLARTLPELDALPEARRARWSLDVDPVDLY